MSYQDIFRDNLKRTRTDQKMKQSQLKEITGFTAISAIETGQRNATLEFAVEAAKALHVSLDYLCGLAGDGGAVAETYGYLARQLVMLVGHGATLSGENLSFAQCPRIRDFLADWADLQRLKEAGSLKEHLYQISLEGLISSLDAVPLEQQ